jgi:hypothetical protein
MAVKMRVLMSNSLSLALPLKSSLSARPLKKVQLQGAAPQAERGVLEVRRSEYRGAATPQMGLFQRPER